MSGYVNYAGEHEGRGPSFIIWNPAASAIADITAGNFSRGYMITDDFMSLDNTRYVQTQATAGTFTLIDAAGGVARADSGSTTENQGINIQGPDNNVSSPAAAEFFIPTASQKIYFEARVRFNESLTTSPPDFFLGLSSKDTSIIGSGANTSVNHIGFEIIDEDGTVDFVSEKSSSRDKDDTITTVVADTWYKFGFVVNGVTSITKYVDGVKDGTLMTDTDDLPIVEMAFSLVCQASATASAQPEVDIDWYRILQVTAGE